MIPRGASFIAGTKDFPLHVETDLRVDFVQLDFISSAEDKETSGPCVWKTQGF